MRYLRTAEVARAAGVHPNTVRRYAEQGLIPPPVGRTPSGYRQFTQRHVDCMKLARLLLIGSYPGRGLRASAMRVVQQATSGDMRAALDEARRHLGQVQAERRQAEEAASLLERWAEKRSELYADTGGPFLSTSKAARLLGVSVDMLYNWERNGLIRVPRDPANNYRIYGPYELGRLRIIRMLGQAGYSHMAMLRMFLQLDRGLTRDLRGVLDTPRPDEDIFSAADRWLSTLAEQERRAREAVELLEGIVV